MKKNILQLVTQQQSVLQEIICDCCGKIVNLNNVCCSDITDLKIKFGYGSKFDMSCWEIDICDDCVEKWVSTFKHQIIKQDYDLL